MKTADKIQKLKSEYKALYADVRREQDTDQQYYDDTFPVPDVKAPHKVVRSGLGRRIVDAPSEQMVTSNPQAFFEMVKGGNDTKDRLGIVSNRWLANLKRGNPNPFKESIKNKLLLGVNYIRIAHNETWVTGQKQMLGLPIVLLLPDPRVLFPSPEEDEEGIPRCMLVMYERQYEEVLVRYPNWQRPDKVDGKEVGEKVAWVEYWDADTVYFEADNVPVRHNKNLYGFTPFTRAYSGFGRRSPDGALSSLVVGDLRYIRDLLMEECSMRSDISSVFHIFAHKPLTLMIPSSQVPPEGLNKAKLAREFSLGAYDFNILVIPDGSKFADDSVMRFEQPSQEAFAYLSEVQAKIERYAPMIMAGFPYGTSGRQQDITSSAAMRRYDTIMENTEGEWARAIEMAFRVIDKVPTLSSSVKGLEKNDLKSQFRCEVKLKAEDPIEADRKAMLGSKLLLNNEIDPETNLVEYKGYTPSRARQILVDTLKYKVLLESPDIAELIGLRAAEKAGMAEDIQKIRARRALLEGGKLGASPTPTAQQRIRGQVKTATGYEDTGSDGFRAPAQERL